MKSEASILDYIKLAAVYSLPQHAISRLIYKATRIESRIVPSAIKQFSKAFNVNLDEALNPQPEHYKTFNAFFTRAIKPELRPIAAGNHIITSPVDGTISQIGAIKDGQLFQAKGHSFTAQTLLGGDEERAKCFEHGQFTTIYLSPRDYHRIHSPLDAELIEHVYIPGRLYSVAPFTVKTLNGIFARNERVAAIFNTEFGKMAVVLVGAINVAAIETVWDGLITPPAKKSIGLKQYTDQNISFNKGDELGRFNMGSTVILLFENKHLQWDAALSAESPLKMGQAIAQVE
jgi:phosphatidylserine decarboxylase